MAVVEVAPSTAVAWPLPTSFEPRDYQLEGLQRIVERLYQVLDHGLGAGKTTTTLAALETVQAMRVLVLCPAKVVAVWRDELDENAARQWVVWAGKVRGNTKSGYLKDPVVARRCEALIQANTDALRIGRPFMAVVNYESMTSKDMQRLLLGTPWDAVVLDEGHRLAAAAGVWSKFVAKLTKRCRDRGGRVVETTGTFMPHTGLSVFGQMRAVNPDVLGWLVTPFRARYASHKVMRQQNACPVCFRTFDRPVGSGCPVLCNDPKTGRIALLEEGEPVYMAMAPKPDGSRVAKDYKIPGKQDDRIPEGVRPDRHQELMDRLSPWVHRVSQAELDAQTGLVEAVPQLRTAVLDPESRKVYDALERDLIAQYDAGVITSANAMTNFGALMRVTRGHARDAATGEIVPLVGEGKLCAAAKLLLDELQDEDPREPIVIFAQWRFDFGQIRLVCEQLGRRYGELSGGRDDGLDGKYMAPNIDLLAVQWQAGSEGLNFTRARHSIDYSLSLELPKFLQAPRRLNRPGQTRHVTRRVLAIEDTVDLNCFYALKRREDINQAVLARLRKGSAS